MLGFAEVHKSLKRFPELRDRLLGCANWIQMAEALSDRWQAYGGKADEFCRAVLLMAYCVKVNGRRRRVSGDQAQLVSEFINAVSDVACA